MSFDILPHTADIGLEVRAPNLPELLSEPARGLSAIGLDAATHPGLLAEEAPYAYKDVSAVVETCEGARLSKRVARLRPPAVVKG